MKVYKKRACVASVIVISIIVIVYIVGALILSNQKTLTTNPTSADLKNHQTTPRLNQNSQSVDIKNILISWSWITAKGVDEYSLINSINRGDLEVIANKLKELTKIINQKGKVDKEYWTTTRWLSDVKNSRQFQDVVAMRAVALKPLYLIIYKSSDRGLYEYICAMTLSEISGYDFSEETHGNGWKDSKDFLNLFNQKIISLKS